VRLIGGFSQFSIDSGRVDTNDGETFSFNDFAVLYRTDAQAAPLVEALGRSGIPFQKRSHHRLASQGAVQEILRALQEPVEELEEGRNMPFRLAQAAERLRDGGEGRTADSDTEITAAVELLLPLATACTDDLEAFLAEVALGAEADTWDPRAERITLMTLHAAKGLEFPVVFLVGCEDGLLPFHFPGQEPDLAEERRLFFVGMTRAESHLYLSHAHRRFRHGSAREAQPSPFLAAISEELLQRSSHEVGAAAGKRQARRRQMRLQ